MVETEAGEGRGLSDDQYEAAGGVIRPDAPDEDEERALVVENRLELGEVQALEAGGGGRVGHQETTR